MSTLETTAAYITTVGKDHTITLPAELPVGSKVAVIVMPKETPDATEAKRRADFESALDVIRTLPQTPRVDISDAELDALIERARKSHAG